MGFYVIFKLDMGNGTFIYIVSKIWLDDTKIVNKIQCRSEQTIVFSEILYLIFWC